MNHQIHRRPRSAGPARWALFVALFAAAPWTSAVSAPPAQARQKLPALEQRLQFLTSKLDLTPVQQAAVRKILIGQSQQVRAVWDNPALSSGDRIGRTRAIGEQTVTGIRALLTEDQRRNYFATMKPPERAAAGDSADAGYWMQQMEQAPAKP